MATTKASIACVLVAAAALGGCKRSLLSHSGGDLPAGDEDCQTILLTYLTDPENHVQHAEACRRGLTEKLGWKGVFVISKAGQSELYWGRYRSVEEARTNLATARAYQTGEGVKPFGKATVVTLPGKDIGPPEWNLRNCPAAYTLLVAVFTNDPERNYIGRRKFAVDYCRRLREGGYEGYFYHGPVVSHVTIGAFGESAVEFKRDQPVERAVIRDPRILELQKPGEFPHLAVNGSGENELGWDHKAKKWVRLPKRTRLMRVPRGEKADGR
jgi:hypothetical protein